MVIYIQYTVYYQCLPIYVYDLKQLLRRFIYEKWQMAFVPEMEMQSDRNRIDIAKGGMSLSVYLTGHGLEYDTC